MHKPERKLRPIVLVINLSHHEVKYVIRANLKPISNEFCPNSRHDRFRFVELIKQFNSAMA